MTTHVTLGRTLEPRTATTRPYAEEWMTDDEQGCDTERGEDSTALHAAAETLRARIPRHGSGPLGEYALLGTAKLLDAVAAALDHGDDVCGEIRTSALEVAHHVRTYPPPEPRTDDDA